MLYAASNQPSLILASDSRRIGSISYHPSGCLMRLIFTFGIDENGKLRNVKFTGGCPGNLTAIPILVEGMSVDELEGKLKGVRCGFKNTSCADQLARAVRLAYEKEQKRA